MDYILNENKQINIGRIFVLFLVEKWIFIWC